MRKSYKLGYTAKLNFHERTDNITAMLAEIHLWRLTQEADNAFYPSPLAKILSVAHSNETPQTHYYGIEPLAMPSMLFKDQDQLSRLQELDWTWSDKHGIHFQDSLEIGVSYAMSFLSKVLDDANERDQRFMSAKLAACASVWPYLNLYPRLLCALHVNGARHYEADREGYHRLSKIQFGPSDMRSLYTDTLMMRQNLALWKPQLVAAPDA